MHGAWHLIADDVIAYSHVALVSHMSWEVRGRCCWFKVLKLVKKRRVGVMINHFFHNHKDAHVYNLQLHGTTYVT